MRIVGTDALCQHVLYSRCLDYRADAATGDHTRAVGGRLEDYISGTETAAHFKRYCPVGHRHAYQALFRLFQPFADSLGNFVCFTHAVTHDRAAVANHDQSAKAEAPATLDDLGDAADMHDFFFQFQSLRINPFQRHLSSSR